MPDRLTGLHTHRELPDEIAAAGSIALLVDIDGFVWFNDQYGHAEGDRVLAAVAKRVGDALIEYGSTTFRVGGDEFLVVVRTLDRAAASGAASKIVSDVHDLAIPYSRRDAPNRRALEVNVAVLPVTARFTDIALGEYGLTQLASDWIAEAVYREKLRLAGTTEVAGTFLERAAKLAQTAGLTVNLLDRLDCPWAG